ncbi:AMP-binding protein [Pseudovibrio exalbescens]|uniref:AMP-binding protein n=1 Tax=Pseudovibrio exalbescens TaxID=197461 RepID=UPI002365D2DE|nr:AMP-binding protein [Pseudovibrio exalbescens]MDD7909643.1 AMP-binding protein [Pseudovibrio exalbescens]
MEWVTDMAAKRAGLSPHALAFIDLESGQEFTFAALNEQAERIAAGLAHMGLQTGDRVAILCLNHVEFFSILFAAQKTGLILVPLNWRQPVAELEPILKLSEATLLIHDDAFSEAAHDLKARVDLPLCNLEGDGEHDLSAMMAAAPANSPEARPIASNAPWYLLYTSGTTGNPKAVIQTAGMAWANAVNYGQAVDLTSTDTSVNFLPLFHTAGINLLTLPLFLAGGCSTVLRKFDADAVINLLAGGKVSAFFGVPAIYQALSLHPRIDDVDFTKLNSLGCGGAPIPAHLLTEFMERGATICNGMGMTETGPTVFLMDKASAPLKVGSVGKAQMLTDVRLEGVDGRIVEGAGTGELQLRGPGITPGYMGNAQATAATFTPDGWLKSGDIAQRDEDGYYYIIDRIKDMYISGGENVYPAEVEKVLTTHPAILEAVVIGVADAKWGEVGAAFLIERPGADLNTADMTGWCRERLAAYKVPKSFQVVDEMPRTAAGKVRKNILKNTFTNEAEEV